MKLNKKYLTITAVLLSAAIADHAFVNASSSEDEQPESRASLIQSQNQAFHEYLLQDQNQALKTYIALLEDCNAISEVCHSNFKKRFNVFLPENDHKESLRLPPLYQKSLIRTLLLESGGFLFVPQGSPFEGELSNEYNRINLYPYLQDNSDWAGELYEALFGRAMPVAEDEKARPLKYLTACMPIKHIYGAKEEENIADLLDAFKAQYGTNLMRTLEDMKQRHSYYLVGLDDNPQKLKDKPHFIVFNQSETSLLEDLETGGYLPADHAHTLILNADQKILSFDNPPHHIGRLILTNGDNQCTAIGDRFLGRRTSLTTIDLQNLPNLTAIGSFFLFECTNLTTTNFQGLANLTFIGFGFLYGCPKLATIDLKGLANITSIDKYYLYGCTARYTSSKGSKVTDNKGNVTVADVERV